MSKNAMLHCSDSVNLFYTVFGSGQPVLMIHGACIDSDFFHEAAVLLSSYFSVITYDRRGYGRSSHSKNNNYSMERQADDAAEIIRLVTSKHGVPCHIIANSAGCSIALMLAERHPELVGNMLLHEPAILDCLPENDPSIKEFRDALNMVTPDRYMYSLFRIFSLENTGNERTHQSTKEELKNRDRNYAQFILHEAEDILNVVPDYEKLKQMKITIGLGERSLNTYHARNCPELCRRVGGELIYFPGGHNCAYDLPKEFAYIATGLLMLG